MVDRFTPIHEQEPHINASVVERTADGVIVGSPLPTGYAYVGDDGGGSYDGSTGRWSVGSVAAGGSETLNITVRVHALGDHVNRAEILSAASRDPDSTPGNGFGNGEDDEATATTMVSRRAPIRSR